VLSSAVTTGTHPGATSAARRADLFRSWNITYLSTSVRGLWLSLYLVIDVWSRMVVAWDVTEREDPVIAADPVSRAYLLERISKCGKHPLVLHVDNGNVMPAATLNSRLEKLGDWRSFWRLHVGQDNPYPETLSRPAGYWPDYRRKPSTARTKSTSD
jgi:putative transposase